MKVAIVERYKTLGGVCLNVGCIPSKALLHNAAVIDEVRHLAANGIKYPEPELDIDMLRGYKRRRGFPLDYRFGRYGEKAAK